MVLRLSDPGIGFLANDNQGVANGTKGGANDRRSPSRRMIKCRP